MPNHKPATGILSPRTLPPVREAMEAAGFKRVSSLREAMAEAYSGIPDPGAKAALEYTNVLDVTQGEHVFAPGGNDYTLAAYMVAMTLRRPMDQLFGDLPPLEPEIGFEDTHRDNDGLTAPEAELYRNEIRNHISEALRGMPERFGDAAAIITLRYGLDGNDPHSQEEAAEALGLGVGHAKHVEDGAIRVLRRRLWKISQLAHRLDLL